MDVAAEFLFALARVGHRAPRKLGRSARGAVGHHMMNTTADEKDAMVRHQW